MATVGRSLATVREELVGKVIGLYKVIRGLKKTKTTISSAASSAVCSIIFVCRPMATDQQINDNLQFACTDIFMCRRQINRSVIVKYQLKEHNNEDKREGDSLQCGEGQVEHLLPAGG